MTELEKMEFVIELAKKAMDNGEFPIAAAIFHKDELISSAYTTENTDGRFLVHAEQKALLDADEKRLPFDIRLQLELYTNLEPCLMCLGMAISSFVGKIYYAVEAPDDGAVELVRSEYERRKSTEPSLWNFPMTTGGLLRKESIQLFRDYVEQNKESHGVEFVRAIAELK